MTTININVRRLSVHLSHFTENHNSAPAALGEGILTSVEQTAEPTATASDSPERFRFERFVKVFSGGYRVLGSDPRIEHVAVIDHVTGLMWAVESLGDPSDADTGISQEQCIQRCKDLRLLGHDDWRLPTRTELVALVDDTRHEPAIDTSLFPRVKSRWHWTSTPAAWSSASAWIVDFHHGSVNSNPRNYNGFALAVRRAGQ